MKYAKLINNQIQYAPRHIIIGGYGVYNPTPEMLIAEGYKPVRTTEPEGEAPAGFHWAETWTETDSEIVQGWELVEVPITDEEALVRYANELTGGADETLTEATETLIKQLKEDK